MQILCVFVLNDIIVFPLWDERTYKSRLSVYLSVYLYLSVSVSPSLSLSVSASISLSLSITNVRQIIGLYMDCL